VYGLTENCKVVVVRDAYEGGLGLHLHNILTLHPSYFRAILCGSSNTRVLYAHRKEKFVNSGMVELAQWV
jgi:hypothetical protein